MGDFTVGDLVEVIWIDVEQDTEYRDGTKNFEPAKTKFKTPGYYTGEDEDYFYFAYALGLDGNSDFMNWAVPMGCVKDVKKIPV